MHVWVVNTSTTWPCSWRGTDDRWFVPSLVVRSPYALVERVPRSSGSNLESYPPAKSRKEANAKAEQQAESRTSEVLDRFGRFPQVDHLCQECLEPTILPASLRHADRRPWRLPCHRGPSLWVWRVAVRCRPIFFSGDLFGSRRIMAELKHRTGETDAGVVDISGDGRLTKKIVTPGNGELPPNDGTHTMVMHYTGRLENGKVFDSSVARNQPFEFTLGAREVILGWDKGVATMSKGEKAILTCHPDYAYGSSGAGGVIPPNATLAFEVELIDWKQGGGGLNPGLVLAAAAGGLVLYLSCSTTACTRKTACVHVRMGIAGLVIRRAYRRKVG